MQFILFFLLLFPASLFAATEQIIVTANRIATNEGEVASSTTLITAEDIENLQVNSVADALRGVPGLNVMNSGGASRSTTIFMRGGNADHVLVMVDGVVVNDPLGTGRGYNFGNLSIQDVERIEVVRGSQSVLYGSDAMGGVVQIITKRGTKRTKQNIFAELGSYKSYQATGNASGILSDLQYYLGAGYERTGGFPAASESRGNSINSPSRRTTATVNGEKKLSQNWKFALNTRYSSARFGYPATGGEPGYDSFGNRTGDDPGFVGEDQQLQVKGEVTGFVRDNWESIISSAYAQKISLSKHDPVYLNSVKSHFHFHSKRYRQVWQNNISTSKNNLITVGLDLNNESGTSTSFASASATDTGIKGKKDQTLGIFYQDRWSNDHFFMTAGARHDYHDGFGSVSTYRFAPGYRWSHTVLRATIGTGFKTPSLYQRFSSFGDPNLRPEKSLSYDFGFDHDLQAIQSKLSFTVFHLGVKSLIDYSFSTSRYVNVNETKSNGVESSLVTTLSAQLTLSSTYTYTDAKEISTGAPLVRRPRHQIAEELHAKISDKWRLGIRGRYVGVRDDFHAITATRLRMPSHTVFFLNTNYQWSSNLQISGRIDNFFDRVYEEVHGYGTAGRSYFLGLNYAI